MPIVLSSAACNPILLSLPELFVTRALFGAVPLEIKMAYRLLLQPAWRRRSSPSHQTQSWLRSAIRTEATSTSSTRYAPFSKFLFVFERTFPFHHPLGMNMSVSSVDCRFRSSFQVVERWLLPVLIISRVMGRGQMMYPLAGDRVVSC